MRGVPFILIFLASLLSFSAANRQEPSTLQEHQAQTKFALPDGTPVRLRFAQAVWGTGSGFRTRPNYAKEGDHVALVVAEDVVIGGKVILRKGSPGQATVAQVWFPPVDMHGVQQYCTCFALQLDWIKSIDREEIPIRPSEKPDLKLKDKGQAKVFTLEVTKTHAGSVANSAPYGFDALKGKALAKGVLGAMTGYTAIKTIHQRDWLPVGTRMTAFVDGDLVLDAAAIDDLQAQLPTPNENATVMLYRTKGNKDKRPLIACDDKEVGQLGPKQFLALELEPGKHTCSADGKSPREISVAGGSEYYLYVQFSGLTGNWSISPVSKGEGEDGVGASEPGDGVKPDEKASR
jgi:hypothetical protein